MGALVEVHRQLGPGLLESAYDACVAEELRHRKIAFVRQAPIALRYRDIVVEAAYYADLIVEGRVLVELKAVEKLRGVHASQALTYLKLTELETGLLVNFHVDQLRNGGVRRLLRPAKAG
jgi:GxxExxY protein